MRIELFGWIIETKRKQTLKSVSGGRGKFVCKGCRITAENGTLMLTDDGGNILPRQTDLIIESKLNAPVIAHCSFYIAGIIEPKGGVN